MSAPSTIIISGERSLLPTGEQFAGAPEYALARFAGRPDPIWRWSPRYGAVKGDLEHGAHLACRAVIDAAPEAPEPSVTQCWPEWARGGPWRALSTEAALAALAAGDAAWAARNRGALNWANSAQAAAGLELTVRDWLRLEGLHHAAAMGAVVVVGLDGRRVTLPGTLRPGDAETAQCWAAMVGATNAAGDTGFAAQFELMISALLRGSMTLAADAPSEVRYLIGRALRVARPWQSIGGAS